MNKTVKYILIITLTLLIGFVIGFLTNGRLTKHRIERMKKSFTHKGFERDFMRAIQPTTKQMDSLKPILDEFAEKNKVLMDGYRTNQKDLFQELRSEIEPFLDDEQIERLDHLRKKWKKRFRDSKSGKHLPEREKDSPPQKRN